VFDTTRTARRLTQTKPLPRPHKHKGFVMVMAEMGIPTIPWEEGLPLQHQISGSKCFEGWMGFWPSLDGCPCWWMRTRMPCTFSLPHCSSYLIALECYMESLHDSFFECLVSRVKRVRNSQAPHQAYLPLVMGLTTSTPHGVTLPLVDPSLE